MHCYSGRLIDKKGYNPQLLKLGVFVMGFITTLLIIVIVIAIWSIAIYNKLQSMMQNIRESFANLQATLKKREQLNGQIIDIASKYMEHEQLVQLQVAQKQGDMNQIRFLMQNFPELRANDTYQKLMDQLERVENDIWKKGKITIKK